jgi:hypothetical protein
MPFDTVYIIDATKVALIYDTVVDFALASVALEMT